MRTKYHSDLKKKHNSSIQIGYSIQFQFGSVLKSDLSVVILIITMTKLLNQLLQAFSQTQQKSLYYLELMSLLLNLINYSSSYQNQYRLSLPIEDEKDERRRSLHHNKIYEQTQKSKIASKSLSKLVGDKYQSNIDPKTRILHRISHIISIKCKRHYYALFVTLQTLKKKDLCMTSEGQYIKLEQRNLIVSQKQKSRKITIQKENKERIIKFIEKIEETQKIILFKQFQQYSKLQFFQLIKNNFLYKDKVATLTQKIQKCDKKLKAYQFFRNLKRMNQYAFKIQILVTLIQALLKKYLKKNNLNSSNTKSQVLEAIRQYQVDIQKVDLNFKDQLNEMKINEKPQFQNQNYLAEKEEQMKVKSQLKKSIQQANLDVRPEDFQLRQQKPQLLQNRPWKNIQFQERIQFKKTKENADILFPLTSKPLESFREKIVKLQKQKFQRNKLTMLKAYELKSSIIEDPMVISKQLHTDKGSLFCKQIPKNIIRPSYPDSTQRLNTLFSQVKAPFCQLANHMDVYNNLKQSQVTPYTRSKIQNISPKNTVSVNKSEQEQKQQIFFSDKISGILVLKTQKSTNTLLNDKQFNFSAIGIQAVNFKNSLVHERESLKQGDRNFMKKPSQGKINSLNQAELHANIFLRNTMDSKAKSNIQKQMISERASFSRDKITPSTQKYIISQPQYKPKQRENNNHLRRPSSCDEQKIQQRQIERQSIIFNPKPNTNLYSNQRIYPTRDTSGVETRENSSQITSNRNRTFWAGKPEKQKSYIKLISKKQISFTHIYKE